MLHTSHDVYTTPIHLMTGHTGYSALIFLYCSSFPPHVIPFPICHPLSLLALGQQTWPAKGLSPLFPPLRPYPYHCTSVLALVILGLASLPAKSTVSGFLSGWLLQRCHALRPHTPCRLFQSSTQHSLLPRLAHTSGPTLLSNPSSGIDVLSSAL